jgi:hypothetical protein
MSGEKYSQASHYAHIYIGLSCRKLSKWRCATLRVLTTRPKTSFPWHRHSTSYYSKMGSGQEILHIINTQPSQHSSGQRQSFKNITIVASLDVAWKFTQLPKKSRKSNQIASRYSTQKKWKSGGGGEKSGTKCKFRKTDENDTGPTIIN